MRKRRKAAGLIIFTGIILAAFFVGCSSVPDGPHYNRIDVKPENIEGPTQENALVFGYINTQGVYFAQINPDREALVMFPGSVKKDGSLRFFQPLAVGSSLQMVYMMVTSGRVIYYQYPALDEPEAPFSIRVTKPGLQYFGSYKVKIVGENLFTLGSDLAFEKDEVKTELDALRLLLADLGETSWEPVISARIKELENGN